jgi:hypothetical protein
VHRPLKNFQMGAKSLLMVLKNSPPTKRSCVHFLYTIGHVTGLGNLQ